MMGGGEGNHKGCLYFVVEPEGAGSPAPSASTASPGVIVFDTWLGDDVVRAYPAILITTPVRDALKRLGRVTGFTIVRARTRRSAFFLKHSPSRLLPVFWQVDIQGMAGRDDMGLGPAGALVVSRRMLDTFCDFHMPRATFAQYQDPAA